MVGLWGQWTVLKLCVSPEADTACKEDSCAVPFEVTQ
jgi:hypothetical protein